MTINLKGNLHSFDKPLLMGILNFTPDSFYDVSRVSNLSEISDRINKMFVDGADIVDIGGMSSQPGAKIITEQEEINRLKPVLEIIAKEFSDKYFSIDTIRASVAKIAVENYGVAIINDISAGEFDKDMFQTVANCKVPYIIMHMKGTPENMQQQTNYKSLTGDLISYFSEKVHRLNSLGVNDIIIDPGFGFSKTIEQNFQLLKKLNEFEIFNLPILAGLSRKSMIWKYLDTTANEALNGTSVLNVIALQNGANILRVHDIKEAKETIELFYMTFNS